MPLELNQILEMGVRAGASDIHLKAGLPPMFRVDGALSPLRQADRMVPDQLQQVASVLMNDVQKSRFEEFREVDLGYGVSGLGRFRVNVFQQRGSIGMVFRVIPFGVKNGEMSKQIFFGRRVLPLKKLGQNFFKMFPPKCLQIV